MITTAYCDILTIRSGIIVHGCNAQGVMGAGLARQIRLQYPECYEVYAAYCREAYAAHEILGTVCWYQQDDLYIANAITQEHYGRTYGKTYVSYVELKRCFEAINQVALELNQPVYFPKIGTGLGGGDWLTIRSIIDSSLDDRLDKLVCIDDKRMAA